MAPAPWDSIPSRQTLFVLVTGANSGIGLGICQRLIDEYLAMRPATHHLVLIPTTRSAAKSRETAAAIRQHARAYAARAIGNLSGTGAGDDAGDENDAEDDSSSSSPLIGHDPRQITARVHVLGLQLDLCDLASVYRAAGQLVGGTLSSPAGLDGVDGGGEDSYFERLVDVRVPRLDSIILNAGMGGWSHVVWPLVAYNILTRGIPQSVTWPIFKGCAQAETVMPLPAKREREKRNKDKPEKDEDEDKDARMGQLFCANVFGHYLFAHELLPLLRRPAGGDEKTTTMALPPGRIIWESSIEASDFAHFSLDDFQAERSAAAYESTKRLTDLLCLTADLPAARRYAGAFLGGAAGDGTAEEKDEARQQPAGTTTIPPRMYLSHPGVVHTGLFPLSPVLFVLYGWILHLARWLGSVWHPITAYKGAAAPAWLALQDQERLDAARAERAKWGSSTDRAGRCRVRETEIQGWGWDGDAGRQRRHMTGRKHGAVDLTPEKRLEFEEMGAACWREMERLRGVWDARVREHMRSEAA